MGDGTNEVYGLRAAFTVSTVLSLAGTLVLVLAYLLFREIRSPRNLLVVWMAITSMIGNASLLLSWIGPGPLPPPGPICWIQGFNRGLFPFISAGLTLALSMYVFRTISRGSIDPKAEHKLILRDSIIQGIVLPLPSVLYPAFMNYYEENYTWCWMRSDLHTAAAYVQWIQYIGTMAAVVVVTIISWHKLKKQKQSESSAVHREFLRNSILYQLAMVICIVPAFIVDLFWPAQFMIYLKVIMEPLFDFNAAVLFGFTESTSAPQSFDETILNPSLRPFIVEFVEVSWMLENLTFLEAVHQYKKLHKSKENDPYLKKKSRDFIIIQFIRSGSPEEVNVSATDRKALLKQVDEHDSIDAQLFDKLEREVKYLLDNMCFPQFLKSQQCANMMQLLNTSKIVAVKNLLTPATIFKRLVLVLRSKFASLTFSKRKAAAKSRGSLVLSTVSFPPPAPNPAPASPFSARGPRTDGIPSYFPQAAKNIV